MQYATELMSVKPIRNTALKRHMLQKFESLVQVCKPGTCSVLKFVLEKTEVALV